MQNIIPKSIPALLTFAGEAVIGVGQYVTVLPLLHNTEENINADILQLVNAITGHETMKTTLGTSRENLRSLVTTSRAFLTLGRDNWKPMLGSGFNANWEPAGFRDSLEIPRAEQEVRPLLRSFHEFLVANPSFEVPQQEITAARANELFTQLEAARGAINLQEALLGQLIELRDEKAEQLRARMSSLIGELKIRMDGLDQRWKAFGLNLPDALETPDGVEHVIATLIGPTAVALKWDPTARAEYYHVFKRVQGVDEDYVLVGSPADLDFTIEDLPSNKQIDIVVSAVNNGGEGERSEAVTITTH